MLTKHVTVKNRVATYTHRDGEIICDNSDFKIIFNFDAEWADKPTKYARFIWNGMYEDVQFTGNECESPFIQSAEFLEVGVCTGDPENVTPDDFWATTAARIPCRTSVLDITDQAQEARVKQMRDEAVQAAEDAAQSAEDAAQSAAAAERSAEIAAECATRAEGSAADVERATAAATAAAQSAVEAAERAEEAADRASAEGGLTEEEATLFNEMAEWYKEQSYVKMTGTFSMTPNISIYEMGSAHNVTFSWTFSKLPIEVTFNGETMNAAESGSNTVNVSSSSHTTLTYQIYGKYKEGETVTNTLSISFRNKYYYGCAAQPASINSSFIKGLSNNGWASSKAISFTPNSTAGTYIWYAYPKRLGVANMWMGGFQGGFDPPITVSITNNSGATEDYYVYKSTNSGIGNLGIEAR